MILIKIYYIIFYKIFLQLFFKQSFFLYSSDIFCVAGFFESVILHNCRHGITIRGLNEMGTF